MFLPASGHCYFDGEADWDHFGYPGCYWSSKQGYEDDAYSLYFNNENGIDVNNDNQSDSYNTCRLVRE